MYHTYIVHSLFVRSVYIQLKKAKRILFAHYLANLAEKCM